MRSIRAAAAVLALCALGTPLSSLSSLSSLSAAPTLSQLRGIDELKRWFNASNGRPRLIFLLSPT